MSLNSACPLNNKKEILEAWRTHYMPFAKYFSEQAASISALPSTVLLCVFWDEHFPVDLSPFFPSPLKGYHRNGNTDVFARPGLTTLLPHEKSYLLQAVNNKLLARLVSFYQNKFYHGLSWSQQPSALGGHLGNLFSKEAALSALVSCASWQRALRTGLPQHFSTLVSHPWTQAAVSASLNHNVNNTSCSWVTCIGCSQVNLVAVIAQELETRQQSTVHHFHWLQYKPQTDITFTLSFYNLQEQTWGNHPAGDNKLTVTLLPVWLMPEGKPGQCWSDCARWSWGCIWGLCP